MSYITNKSLGIKLINILDQLKVGRYELTRHTENNTYHLVLYNKCNTGVYAAIYNINHKFLNNSLIRLKNTINIINEL